MSGSGPPRVVCALALVRGWALTLPASTGWARGTRGFTPMSSFAVGPRRVSLRVGFVISDFRRSWAAWSTVWLPAA